MTDLPEYFPKLKTGIFVKQYQVDGAVRVEVLKGLNKQESKWWEKHLFPAEKENLNSKKKYNHLLRIALNKK